METEINIAEILKDKPNGTKLYADAFGELSLECIKNNEDAGIYVKSKTFASLSFYGDGKYTKYGEPILVPSKKMRDWSKFAWKKGDVLVSNNGSEVLFEKFNNDEYTEFTGRYVFEQGDTVSDAGIIKTSNFKALHDVDKVKDYIAVVEKLFGGKLNLKTLEIEKPQQEFKDGDVIVTDAISSLCYSKCIFILKGDLNIYGRQANSYVFYNVENNHVDFDVLDTMIRDRNIRLATKKEKKELFEALARKGKTWNTEKKVVEDIKFEHQFKPFEKVLVRDNRNEAWRAAFFSYINEYKRYVTTSMAWKYCVPYEGNEHLLGTTKDVEE